MSDLSRYIRSLVKEVFKVADKDVEIRYVEAHEGGVAKTSQGKLVVRVPIGWARIVEGNGLAILRVGGKKFFCAHAGEEHDLAEPPCDRLWFCRVYRLRDAGRDWVSEGLSPLFETTLYVAEAAGVRRLDVTADGAMSQCEYAIRRQLTP